MSGTGGSPIVARLGRVLGPTLFLAILVWPDLPLDPAQRRVAAITALVATWWITVALPIGATSLLPAALFPLFGVLPATQVAPMYMSDLVLLFLGAFIVALGLERWGVHRRVALFVISKVGTKPRNLVLGFMVASAFLSMWINNTATTLLMLPIGMAVLTSLGEKHGPGSPFAVALLLGMAYSASVGGMSTPVGTTPNQVFLQIFRDSYPDGPPIDFGTWMLSWTPLVLIYIPVGWLILTRLALRVEGESARGGDVIREERAKLGPMSGPEKTMATVFVTTALLWVTRAGLDLGFVEIPGWGPLFAPASAKDPARMVSDATVALFMAVLCFLIPVDRKRRIFLMDWRTASRLPWEVLLLLGGGFCIAGAFKASGLDHVLGEGLSPLLAGRPDWLVVCVVVVFMAALTEITSNTATTMVLLPVLGSAAAHAGVSPLLAMLPATIAASAAFMMPVATPPNAVVFASGRVPAPTMARVGLWMNGALVVLVVVVFQLWVRRLLSIEPGLPPWANP